MLSLIHICLSYLSNPKIYTGMTVPRDKICALEIWVECFHRAKADLTKRDTRQINGILSEILKDKPEWIWDLSLIHI